MFREFYPKSMDRDALWTREEICEYLGCGKDTLISIEGRLKVFYIGKRKMAFARDVIEFAKEEQQRQCC